MLQAACLTVALYAAHEASRGLNCNYVQMSNSATTSVAYQDFTLHFHNTQVYRALMLVSLFIAAVAFVLIFVAHSNTNGLVSIVRGQLLV